MPDGLEVANATPASHKANKGERFMLIVFDSPPNNQALNDDAREKSSSGDFQLTLFRGTLRIPKMEGAKNRFHCKLVQ